MSAVFVHDGNAIDYTPGADVTAGDVVVLEDLVGVARLDIAANTLGALAVAGVFDFPKAEGSGEGISTGTTVFWNPTQQEASEEESASEGTLLLGKAVKDAADDDATVRVRMSQ
jgi:predicted RecA/RadA family phage recombinase